MIKTNTSSINVNISDLIGNTCYMFGVHDYTVNGYGLWTVIGNQTFFSVISSQMLSSTTIVLTIYPQPTLCTRDEGM